MILLEDLAPGLRALLSRKASLNQPKHNAQLQRCNNGPDPSRAQPRDPQKLPNEGAAGAGAS